MLAQHAWGGVLGVVTSCGFALAYLLGISAPILYRGTSVGAVVGFASRPFSLLVFRISGLKNQRIPNLCLLLLDDHVERQLPRRMDVSPICNATGEPAGHPDEEPLPPNMLPTYLWLKFVSRLMSTARDVVDLRLQCKRTAQRYDTFAKTCLDGSEPRKFIARGFIAKRLGINRYVPVGAGHLRRAVVGRETSCTWDTHDTLMLQDVERAVKHCAAVGHANCIRGIKGWFPDEFSSTNHHESILVAISEGHLACIRTLHELGARWSPQGEFEVLSCAVRHGRDECIQLLSDLGINLGVVGPENRSALHAAAELGQVLCVKKLVSLGASIDARDVCGQTPAHRAAITGQVECLQVLESLGANMHASDSNGITPGQVRNFFMNNARCSERQTK